MSEDPASWAPHQLGRPRVVTACLPCRRRKVKCDHAQPICSACKRGDRACSYPIPQDEIRTRLDRLEKLLEQALTKSGEQLSPALGADAPQGSHNGASPASAIPGSADARETLSADGYDGALLLDSGTGKSRWVSSLHYALLADQIHDVKMLLGEQISGNPVAESMSLNQSSPQFPFTGTTIYDLTPWLPGSSEECFNLLETFFSNVDPMTRVVHKPSLRNRFAHYVNHVFGVLRYDELDDRDACVSATTFHMFEPLAFAIFHAAINSLSPEAVLAAYSSEKDPLLAQFQRGVELGLGRENFLTTSSMEVLQAFVLLLTCQSREDDMARTWTFLGLAIRIALSQGLHREPSLFPSTNMDVIQVELRRRLWHQICHLDFRSAESTGQEPTISDDNFTTLLPRNIDDEDLNERLTPAPKTSSASGFTDMSGHLIRLHGLHCFRRIVRSTYRLERRLKSSMGFGNHTLYPISEFQAVFIEVRTMIEEMQAHLHAQYLAFCNPQIPEHRLALGLAVVVEWRCWSIFWLRTPKQYREDVVSRDIRQTVLNGSISLLESMNMMPDDKDAKRFQWHIGSFACFQAIMHIVSELETPEFKAPHHEELRSRSLVALQATVDLRGRGESAMWNVINRIISNCLNKNSPSSCSALTVSPTSMSLPEAMFNTQSNLAAVEQQISASNSTVENYAYNNDLFGNLMGVHDVSMPNPSLDFDWGFFNIDPTGKSSS